MQGQVLLENYGREISDRTTEMLSGVGFGPEGGQLIRSGVVLG